MLRKLSQSMAEPRCSCVVGTPYTFRFVDESFVRYSSSSLQLAIFQIPLNVHTRLREVVKFVQSNIGLAGQDIRTLLGGADRRSLTA
jgi:hypothetical protein